MKSVPIVFCFLFILKQVCFCQYPNSESFRYLMDHAVFFGNGITSYAENGKYGFIYKNHRLTEPVYDTLFLFGKDICIAKKDSKYSLLDQNLKDVFTQEIRSVNKFYSIEKESFILTIETLKNDTWEYFTNEKYAWSPKYLSHSQKYIYQDPLKISQETNYSIVDALDHADKFPEAPGFIKILMNERMAPESPYQLILFSPELLKFFPKSGKPFVRQRKGLQAWNYLAASIIEYRNRETEEYFLIDEEKEDTLIRSESGFSSFFSNGHLYLYTYLDKQQEDFRELRIYNDKGQFLHAFTPETIKGKTNAFWMSNSLILEKLTSESKQDAYPLYTIYAASTLKCLLEKVILFQSGQKYGLYYSPSKRTYYLLSADQIICSFTVKKDMYVELDHRDYPHKNKLFCIRVLTHKEKLVKSLLISSSGKILDRSDSCIYQVQQNMNEEVLEVFKRSPDDQNKSYALYYPEKDSLQWLQLKDDYFQVLSKDVLYYFNYGSQKHKNRLENLNGDTILAFGDQELSLIKLKDHHFIFTLQNQSNGSVYDDDFQLMCDNCSIYPIDADNTVFILRRDFQSPLFELADARLIPLSQQKYLAHLRGEKMIALLTENYQVEYYRINE